VDLARAQRSQFADGRDAATVLGNIANTMEKAEELINACREVAAMADTRATQINEIVDTVLRTHPEWAPTAVEEAQAIEAEMQVQPVAGDSRKAVAVVGAAAAGLAILAAVA
jgi:hypothetical protein